jgi:hypothetical protein
MRSIIDPLELTVRLEVDAEAMALPMTSKS